MKRPGPEDSRLADEMLLVRHSGELPEVALHGSIFFLTADQEGPGMDLTPEDLRQLKRMVVARYREIINRDLDPGNRDRAMYRGLARSITNWQRITRFCSREGFVLEDLQKDTAGRLISFLENELVDVRAGRKSSVNCCQRDLCRFAEQLTLGPDDLPKGWQDLCQNEDFSTP